MNPLARRTTRTAPAAFGASRLRLASLLLAATAVCAVSGQAWAEEGTALEDKAVNGQLADLGSTGIGLALGAAEANPLGLLTLGVKAYAYQQIKAAPAVEQPAMWSAYGAFGWGAAANNVCVIAAIASGGAAAAICPLIGLATGMTTWNGDEAKRDRATFAVICDQQRKVNPALTCSYNDPKG